MADLPNLGNSATIDDNELKMMFRELMVNINSVIGTFKQVWSKDFSNEEQNVLVEKISDIILEFVNFPRDSIKILTEIKEVLEKGFEMDMNNRLETELERRRILEDELEKNRSDGNRTRFSDIISKSNVHAGNFLGNLGNLVKNLAMAVLNPNVALKMIGATALAGIFGKYLINPITALIAGIAGKVGQAMEGALRGPEFNTSSLAASLATFLAGDGSDSWLNKFTTIGGWVGIGAGIGFATKSPIGIIAGAIIGGIIGAVLYSIGPEKIADWVQRTQDELLRWVDLIFNTHFILDENKLKERIDSTKATIEINNEEIQNLTTELEKINSELSAAIASGNTSLINDLTEKKNTIENKIKKIQEDNIRENENLQRQLDMLEESKKSWGQRLFDAVVKEISSAIDSAVSSSLGYLEINGEKVFDLPSLKQIGNSFATAVSDTVDRLKTAGENLKNLRFEDFAKWWNDQVAQFKLGVNNFIGILENLWQNTEEARENIKKKWDALVLAISGLGNRIVGAFTTMIDYVVDTIKSWLEFDLLKTLLPDGELPEGAKNAMKDQLAEIDRQISMINDKLKTLDPITDVEWINSLKSQLDQLIQNKIDLEGDLNTWQQSSIQNVPITPNANRTSSLMKLQRNLNNESRGNQIANSMINQDNRSVVNNTNAYAGRISPFNSSEFMYG